MGTIKKIKLLVTDFIRSDSFTIMDILDRLADIQDEKGKNSSNENEDEQINEKNTNEEMSTSFLSGETMGIDTSDVSGTEVKNCFGAEEIDLMFGVYDKDKSLGNEESIGLRNVEPPFSLKKHVQGDDLIQFWSPGTQKLIKKSNTPKSRFQPKRKSSTKA